MGFPGVLEFEREINDRQRSSRVPENIFRACLYPLRMRVEGKSTGQPSENPGDRLPEPAVIRTKWRSQLFAWGQSMGRVNGFTFCLPGTRTKTPKSSIPTIAVDQSKPNRAERL